MNKTRKQILDNCRKQHDPDPQLSGTDPWVHVLNKTLRIRIPTLWGCLSKQFSVPQKCHLHLRMKSLNPIATRSRKSANYTDALIVSIPLPITPSHEKS